MFFEEFLCLRKKASAIKNCIIIAKNAALDPDIKPKNNTIINLYVVLVFKSSDGSTMLTKPTRTESDIQAGTGSFVILHATGVFEKYLQYKCKYAISTSNTGAFIQENICKKN